MIEIEKMYENAGIEKLSVCEYTCMNATNCNVNCVHYNDKTTYYPPFTAEKQLKLIKWLSTKELKIRTNKQPYAVYIGVLGDDNTCFYGCEGLYFEQTLAELVNVHWQDLRDYEKVRLREILK